MDDNKNSKNTIVYSVLTILVTVFLIQSGFGLILNILKNINIHTQLQVVKHANKKALNENTKIRDEIENCKSEKSIESIARNNLKMAADDEILLNIVSKNNEPVKKETKPKEKGIFIKH